LPNPQNAQNAEITDESKIVGALCHRMSKSRLTLVEGLSQNSAEKYQHEANSGSANAHQSQVIRSHQGDMQGKGQDSKIGRFKEHEEK
jgi:hypothetical protein